MNRAGDQLSGEQETVAAMCLAGGCLLMILPAARDNKSFLKEESEWHVQHSPHEETEAGSSEVTCQGQSWEGAELDTCSQRELEPEHWPILDPVSFPQYSWEHYTSKLFTPLFISLQLNFSYKY